MSRPGSRCIRVRTQACVRRHPRRPGGRATPTARSRAAQRGQLSLPCTVVTSGSDIRPRQRGRCRPAVQFPRSGQAEREKRTGLARPVVGPRCAGRARRTAARPDRSASGCWWQDAPLHLQPGGEESVHLQTSSSVPSGPSATPPMSCEVILSLSNDCPQQQAQNQFSGAAPRWSSASSAQVALLGPVNPGP